MFGGCRSGKQVNFQVVDQCMTEELKELQFDAALMRHFEVKWTAWKHSCPETLYQLLDPNGKIAMRDLLLDYNLVRIKAGYSWDVWSTLRCSLPSVRLSGVD